MAHRKMSFVKNSAISVHRGVRTKNVQLSSQYSYLFFLSATIAFLLTSHVVLLRLDLEVRVAALRDHTLLKQFYGCHRVEHGRLVPGVGRQLRVRLGHDPAEIKGEGEKIQVS